MSAVDLCMCLGGVQAMDATYAQRLQADFDCVLHDSHAGVTVAGFARGCMEALQTDQLQMCGEADYLALATIAADAADSHPALGCDKLAAFFTGGWQQGTGTLPSIVLMSAPCM